MTTSIDYEATGPNYAVDKLLDVRERVHQAIAAVSAKIVPGMVEEDAVAMARGILGDMGMRKGWHRVIVRFGPNTTKDFYADSDPGVMSSCEQGICSSCETAVLAGVPDHRDSVLTAKEHAANDYMVICVSRALTPRLVLDL